MGSLGWKLGMTALLFGMLAGHAHAQQTSAPADLSGGGAANLSQISQVMI